MNAQISPTSLPYIRSVVSRLVRADSATIDDLASDVWTECFEKGYLPSKNVILHIVIDWLRHKKVEDDARITICELGKNSRHYEPNLDLCNFICQLTPAEQSAIYEAFWLDTPVASLNGTLNRALTNLLVLIKKEQERD